MARFKKGSAVAKRYMAKIRRKKGKHHKKIKMRHKRKHSLRHLTRKKISRLFRRFKRHRRTHRRTFKIKGRKLSLENLAVLGVVSGAFYGVLQGKPINVLSGTTSTTTTTTTTPPPPQDVVTLNAFTQSISPDGMTYTFNGVVTSSGGSIVSVVWNAVGAPQFSFVKTSEPFWPIVVQFATAGSKTYNIVATDTLGQTATFNLTVNVTPTATTGTTTTSTVSQTTTTTITSGGQKAPASNPPPVQQITSPVVTSTTTATTSPVVTSTTTATTSPVVTSTSTTTTSQVNRNPQISITPLSISKGGANPNYPPVAPPSYPEVDATISGSGFTPNKQVVIGYGNPSQGLNYNVLMTLTANAGGSIFAVLNAVQLYNLVGGGAVSVKTFIIAEDVTSNAMSNAIQITVNQL